MKKIVLSGLLIIIFLAYIIHEKSESTTLKLNQSNNQAPSVTNAPTANNNKFKDGEYTSSVGDAFYGPLQIKLLISGGKVTDVVFLQYPNDRPTSTQINEDAIPILKQEAITEQSANVDIVTGATQTAEAFQLLLKETLGKAKA